MKKSQYGRSRGAGGSKNKKVSCAFRLARVKIEDAQKILKTRTATETIETALDLVVFRSELVEGGRRSLGIQVDPPDGSEA